MGGVRESTSVTRRPFARAAMAAANPAGPPPTINTSVWTVGFRYAYHRRRTNSEQKPGPIAARMLNVPGTGRRCL